MSEHPPIDVLARFARGVLPPRELAAVAIHVARCEVCRTAATRPSLHPESAPTTYGEAIHRVAGWAKTRTARHNRDRRQAPGALDQILALPTEDWNRAIRSSPRYQSYAFAQHALKTCKAGWSDNPHRSERLAQLALEVANRLPNREHGRRNLNDLRARAWAYVANCRRVQTSFSSVPDALQAAAEHHHAGTGAGSDLMMLLSFTRSYLSETHRYEAAGDLVSELEEVATHFKDRHIVGRNRWALSRIQMAQQQKDQALHSIRDACRLMEERREFGSTVRLTLALAHLLGQAGNLKGALSTLRAISQNELQRLARLEQLRFTWTTGLLYWRIGDLRPALAKLDACRRGFLSARIPNDVALLDLEIAQIRLELGQRERALVAIAGAFPSFVLHGQRRKSLAAISLFRQAGGLE